MIELFYSPTPNGRKISIMLEECKIDYKITLINLSKDEQFKPEFLKLNPYGKIPVIIDHEKDLVLIESGAILIYLAKITLQYNFSLIVKPTEFRENSYLSETFVDAYFILFKGKLYSLLYG